MKHPIERTVLSGSILLAIAVWSCRLQAFGQAVPGEEREWRDEIVSVVIVQKFLNGDPTNDVMRQRFGAAKDRYEGGFWGGDLEGVIRRLDYFSELGVTALLLYPVVANDPGPFGKYLATGYRPRDYFSVDENFGDMATLKRLVDLAHGRKLRMILDMPLGMPGPGHPFLQDPSKADWFGPPTPYGVRQWNAENPAVADYLIRISQFWKEQSGCDGFRLDSAHLHSERFWQRYARELRGERVGRDRRARRDEADGFILLAEVPRPPRAIGEFLRATGFDSAYDFSVGVVRDVLGAGSKLETLSRILREGKQAYPAPSSLSAQIDNYEKPDFLSVAVEPKLPRLKLALTFLLTLDRVPLLYSGDEAALSYREVGALFHVPEKNREFVESTKKLIGVRKSEVALRRGDFVEVLVRDPVYAFARLSGDERVLVVLNNSDRLQTVAIPPGAGFEAFTGLRDLIRGETVEMEASGTRLELEPWGARICRVIR